MIIRPNPDSSNRAFDIVGSPKECRTPLVVHVPHSATAIPLDIRSRLLLSNDELAEELLRVTDHFTDELFSCGLAANGVAFVNRLSRLVVDPERFRLDEMEPAARSGAGAVYERTTSGRPLRQLSADLREELLERFYDPYADAMGELVSVMLDRFGRCSIIDAHSYPTEPLPWEQGGDDIRPEICIGTDSFHTPSELCVTLLETARAHGRSVAVDSPFAGTYVPERHLGSDPRVTSVMIEIRRDVYMDEAEGTRTRGFHDVAELVAALVEDTVSCLA